MAEGRYVKANGLNIYYEEMGEGAPLILLHGGTATASSWAAHAPAFAEHFRVIMPDARGHGHTVNPAQGMTYAMLAADCAAFIKALGLHKPSILGYSDGGQIALEVGIRYTELAGALVLGGTAYKFAQPYFDLLTSWGIEGAGIIDFARLENSMADVLDYWRAEHAPLGGTDYWKTLLHAISTLWWTPPVYTDGDLRKVAAPALVLMGDRDDAIGAEQAVKMYRLLPGAELAILPHADHGGAIGDGEPNPHFVAIARDFLLRRNPPE